MCKMQLRLTYSLSLLCECILKFEVFSTEYSRGLRKIEGLVAVLFILGISVLNITASHPRMMRYFHLD